MPVHLAMVLHAHQPVGNFDNVIEDAYQRSYLPFLDVVEPRPWLHFTLHFTGFLLDWLAHRHPDYIVRLRALLAAGRLEILGGGYFEPILAAIPPEDQREQLRRLSGSLERHFNDLYRRDIPLRGAWLAERVWEPEMAAALAQGGIDFTLLDDVHFESANVAADDLHGYWFTESLGRSLRVVPSNYRLRQTIPFQPVEASFEYLEAAAAAHPDTLLTMGDDLEKFGCWPHTHQHVYVEGWLNRFLDGLEQRRDTIHTVRVGAYLAQHASRGLIYMPSGSYPEMMQWAGNRTWRGFLTKYREANLLHKTQWDLTRQLRACRRPRATRARAWAHLLAAECNDVYWHGWFGGVYSPHMRNVAFTHLLEADALLAPKGDRMRRVDLHGDGSPTLELRTPELRILVRPDDGGTIEEIDHRPTNANVVNSIQRRPESYHATLRERLRHNPANLPEHETPEDRARLAAQAAELDARLIYDPVAHACGRLYRCPPECTLDDFRHQRLQAASATAEGAYRVLSAEARRIELAAPGGAPGGNDMRKEIILKGNALTVTVNGLSDSSNDVSSSGDSPRQTLLEMLFNLLAPDADDRYLEHNGERRRLDWAGELAPGTLRLRDGWRRLTITLDAPGARAWWIDPLYSVSQSEQGFEALYQGSALAAVWPPGVESAKIEVNFFLD